MNNKARAADGVVFLLFAKSIVNLKTKDLFLSKICINFNSTRLATRDKNIKFYFMGLNQPDL